MKLTRMRDMIRKDNVAWCVECNDQLETKTIWRNDPKFGKIIDHFEYYCMVCDKTFILTEIKGPLTIGDAINKKIR